MSGIFNVVGGKVAMTTTLPVPAYGDGGKIYDASGALYVADSSAVVSWANGCAFGSGGAMLIYDASVSGLPLGTVFQNGLPFYNNRMCVDVLNAGTVVSGGTPFVGSGAVAAVGGGAGFSLTTSFFAPLKTSLVPQVAAGSPTPTFTRATPAYVADCDGVLRQAVSGEARFSGARRVQNTLADSENLNAASWSKLQQGTGVLPVVTTGFTGPTGAANACRVQMSLGATPTSALSRMYGPSTIAGTMRRNKSLWIRSNTGSNQNIFMVLEGATPVVITVTPTWTRFTGIDLNDGASGGQIQFGISGATTGFGETDPTADILVFGGQIEIVSGASNSAPSEYVSVGVLAAPWHGAGVDGVRYFSTANPNSVSGNVVTTNPAGGTAIPDATLLGYLAEGQRTNVFLYSQDFSQNPTWYNGATGTPLPVSASSSAAPNGTATAWTFTNPTAMSAVQNANFAVAGDYTMSMWARKVGAAAVGIRLSLAAGGGTAYVLTTDWQRIFDTRNMAAVGVVQNVIEFNTPGAAYEIWGAQLEAAPFASSYIPTTTAAATRNGDVLTYPSAGNLSFAIGTAYAELSTNYTTPSSDSVALSATGSGRMFDVAGGSAATTIRSYDGTTAVTKTGLTSMATSVGKRAVSWSATQNITGDGLAVQSGAFDGSMGSGSFLEVGAISGTNQADGTIRNVRIYAAALSDAQLIGITTP